MPLEPMPAGGGRALNSHRQALRLACVAVFLSLTPVAESTANAAAPGPANERTEAGRLAAQYVDDAASSWELEARQAFRKAEVERLSGAAGLANRSVTQSFANFDAETRRAMSSLLEENNQPALAALEAAVEESSDRRREIVDRWRSIRAAEYARRLELFEVKANKFIAGQLASLLSVDNRWFWLCGLIAVLTLVMAAAHERRHEVRRRLNGGRARAMGLSNVLGMLALALAMITATTFVFGDRVYHWLLKAGSIDEADTSEQLAEMNRKAAARRAGLQRGKADVDGQYERVVADWQRRQTDQEPKSALWDQWRQSRQALETLTANLAVEAGAAQQMETDLKALEALQGDVAANAQQRDAYRRRKRWIRGGLGLGLLGLAAGGGTLFRRGVKRRLEKTRNTCPLCLGEGTFEPASNSGLGGAASGGHVALDMVQCKNVISEQPYEECEFTFMSMYREIAKLCFPTLGIPQAGKTHWLAMVYRELNRGNYPEVVQFERIKSASSDEFDLVVDEILNKKMGPMATQVGRIPHPLVFNFLDRDRFGASNILVNIFDYSGEVIRSQTIEDRQRQRALDGDGFFFFLDPTEPSETQSQALAGFREDLRRIKGLKAGRQVHIPVALCVSKIDLMVDEPYADPDGGGVIDHFYRDLGEVGWDMSLRSIAARSRLMARLRDTVWPGWQIERQIDDLFGGRYMFFPLTPVGLEGAGEHDLSRRTIAPLGLLDPLLWLLHMNGYPVLK